VKMESNRNWVRICTVDDIAPLGSRVVRRPKGADVAVFRAEGDFIFAVLDRCPHRGGALSQGIVHGHKVTCPLHNWNIALDCGEAVAPDVGCTPTFETRVLGGEVYLDAAQLDSIGLDEAQPAWSKMVRLSV
jgi:nitrite reductase (NADH) small subunit